jgi:hypothetical protein
MCGKFKTHPLVLAGLLITWLISIASAQVKQDISADLARAQAFYDSSRFEESLILLRELEKRIGTGPQQANDLLKTKLYMGLANLSRSVSLTVNTH